MPAPIHAETQEITGSDALRQGDIFEWREGLQEEPWRCWGIVVTADCDIVQQKHGEALSYVPLLKVSDFTRLFILPPLLLKKLLPTLSQMVKVVHALQARYQPEFPEPLTAELLESLLMESGSASLLDGLGVPPGKGRNDASNLLEDVIAGLNAQRSQGGVEQFEAIVRLRGGRPEHRTNLRTQINDKFANLPGDAFFVGEVEGIEEKGFVACLRLVREIPISAVALKMPDLEREGVTTRRVARMHAPFVYRLTQQLGDVFSSIGLPRSYEDARKGYISKMWPTPQTEGTK